MRRTALALLLVTATFAGAHAQSIEVTYRARMVDQMGSTMVIADTNLPDGTQALVIVQMLRTNFLLELRGEVAAGRINIGPVFNQGRPLQPGFYAVGIVSTSPLLQPPFVQRLIGNMGERLTGPLVRNHELGRHLRAWQIVEFCPERARC